MLDRMHTIKTEVLSYPQRDRTESEWYEGAQTYIWMVEDNVVEVPFDREHLLEMILSPDNLNKAYKAVVRNKGCGGIDRMSCEELLPWLLANKKSLICSLMDGSYRPNPVRRVEIPKDNGKMRLLGIPTVVDRLVQQAINQVLTLIYEPQFSPNSYGFRPRRGCLDALCLSFVESIAQFIYSDILMLVSHFHDNAVPLLQLPIYLALHLF